MRVEHVQGTFSALAVMALIALAVLGANSASAGTSHDPISIVGNNALLAAANGTWVGNGTASNPIIIEGYDIIPGSKGGTGPGIYLDGTTLHVIIRDVRVEFGGTLRDGIHLRNTRNVTVADSWLESNRVGLVLDNAASTNVNGVTMRTSQTGLSLQASTANVFNDNRIQLNGQDVRLTTSVNNTFTNNNLSISSGQTGWFFVDNASYDNAIPLTNVVNGVPTQWHVRPQGTTGTPQLIDRPNVTLKGITNVAQVMIYMGRDIEVRSPAASEGAAAGLVVFGGERVRVTDAFAERNAGAGVLAEQTASLTLVGATARENMGRGVDFRSTPQCAIDALRSTQNRANGLALTHAPGCALTAPRADDNTGVGISLVSSPDAQIDDASVARNQGGGVFVDLSPRANVTRAILADNAGTGLRLLSAPGASVNGSTLTGNTVTGIHLSTDATNITLRGNTLGAHPAAIKFTQAHGATLTGNAMAITTGFALQFDDEPSYDNAIDTTNVANGRPIHWYTRLNGTEAAPIQLAGLTSETRGVTNVAQIMLYRSQNVTLERPIAKNGTAAGIRFFESTASIIDVGVAQNNTAHGVDLTGGRANRVQQTNASNNGGSGIRIDRSSRDHALANVRVQNNTADGLTFITADGLDVRDGIFQDNKGRGISGESSSGVTLVANAVSRNVGDGVRFYRVGGAVLNNDATRNGAAGYSLIELPAGTRLETNRAVENAQGVRLRATQGLTIKANEVTIRTGETGFHFDDATSYQTLIDTTNRVNGTPMRWYFNVHGNSTTDPLVITGVNVSTRGITNVAQLLVSSSSNVTFQSPVIRNGTAAGVRIIDSTGIIMESALVETNTADGVMVNGGSQVSVANGTIQRNTGHGVLLDGSAHAVTGSRVVNNARTGISVAVGSNGANIRGATIEGNAAGGVVLASTTESRLDANSLSANGPVGIAASQNNFLRVTNNTLHNHANHVRITSQTGAWFDGNVITLSSGQFGFHFDQESSYKNFVNETNLVDGTPVRWYFGDQAGRVVSGATVLVPRITNVAQVMVHDATNLTLENAHVANGLGYGILIQRSTAIRVEGGNVTNNTGDGLRIDRQGEGVLVQNVAISANGGSGITAARATDIALVKNTVTSNLRHGISLEKDTRNANLTSNLLQRNTLDGIHLEATFLGTIAKNGIANNGRSGIALVGTQLPAKVTDNLVSGHTSGVRLTATVNTRFESNDINIQPGQTGFYFDDTTSYDNLIDTTNLVNGVPVRWYLQLAGTIDAPIRLENVAVEVRGITNVAQIMLYRSSYVAVNGVTASNGTGHGIYLYASSAVNVTATRAENNTHGISLYSTVTSAIERNILHTNSIGVHIEKSRDVQVADNDATNSRTGVRIADAGSSNNRVYRTTTTGATVDSVFDATYVAGSPNRGNNFIADAGLDKVGRVNMSVAFNDPTGVAREQRDTIMSQTWHFGDGATAVAANGNLLQSAHAYAHAGTFLATYELKTLAGETYSDSLLVKIIPNLTAPRDVSAVAKNATVVLNWTVPEFDSGLPVERYRVYRSADGAPVALVDELRNVTNYTDTSVVGGRTYQYLVSAVNADGESPRSDSVEVFVRDVPTAPAGLAVVDLDGNTTFSWSPSQGRGAPVAGYRVYELDAAGNRSLRFEPGNVTAHVAQVERTEVLPRFLVTAYNSEGESLPSSPITLWLALRPDAPERFEVRSGDAFVTLSWRAPLVAGSAPITNYTIERAVDGGPFAFLGNTTSFQFNDSSVENGRAYAYRIAASNDVGTGPSTAVVRVRPSVEDLDAPTFGAHTPATSAIVGGPITLRIDYDDPSGIALDTVVLMLDGIDVTAKANVNATGLSYVMGELAPGTHQVVVRVEDSAGNLAREVWSFEVVAPEEVPAEGEPVPVAKPTVADNATAGGAKNATAPTTQRANATASEDQPAPVRPRARVPSDVTFAERLGVPGPGIAFAVAAFVAVALARKRRLD